MFSLLSKSRDSAEEGKNVSLRQLFCTSRKRENCAMTPPPELVECANCDCWFAAAATDEVFHHGTGRCRRREQAEPAPFTDPSPPRNAFSK
jgi:hypothetical protein